MRSVLATIRTFGITALLFGVSALFADVQAATRYVGSCGTPNTSTIAAAITAAAAGDTILVCPGTYNEAVTVSKDNLIIRGSTGNRGDVTVSNSGIPIAIDGANPTLMDLSIASSNNHGVHRKWSNSASSATFSNLSVTAKLYGIYVETSTTVKMNNLAVTSSNSNALQLAWGTNGSHEFDTITATAANGEALHTEKGGIVFRNLTLDAKNAALYISPVTNAVLENIKVSSSNGHGIHLAWANPFSTLDLSNIESTAKERGIYIEKSGKVTLSNVTATSSNSDAIYLAYGASGAHEFRNLKLDAKNYGLYAERGGTIFKDIEIATSNGDGMGMYSDYDAVFESLKIKATNGVGLNWLWANYVRTMTLKGIDIASKNNALHIAKSGVVTIDGLKATSTHGDAIYLGSGASSAHSLRNMTLSAAATARGIFIANVPSTTVSNVCVDNSNTGIELAWDARNVAISNTKLTAGSYGIDTQANSAGKTIVSNSCFPKSSAPRALSNSTTHKFDGNYWQGVAGGTSYADGNVRDSSTLGTCPVSSCYSNEPPATLSAHYNFDDTWNSGDALDDNSGNNRHAALSGTVSQERATASGGKPDTCKTGNFNKLGYFTTMSGLDIDTVADKKNSVSFWMYWDGGFHSSSFTMPFSWGGTYYDLAVSKYRSEMGNGVIGFNTGNGDVYGATADGLANGWHHVAAVFNNGNVTQNKLYIDGVAKSLTSYGSHNTRSATGSAGIGAGAGWGGDYKWSGRLDNLKIYKGEITTAQIAADMAETSSCLPVIVGEWRMDELAWNGTAGEIKDNTGAYHGVAVGATTVSGGRICQAGNLTASGTADYLRIPEAVLHGRSDFSLALWVNTSVSKAQQELLQGLGSGVTNNQIEMYLVNKDRVVANIQNSNNITFTSPVTLTDGKWHHLALTRQGTQGCLYVDGSLAGACQTFPSGAMSITANTLLLGQEQDSYGGGFSAAQSLEGKLDEFKIWDSPLTAEEILAGYLNEATGKNWDGTTRTCAITSAPANFNCVEVGGNAATGRLYTKLAGSQFGIDVVALKADGSVETQFASDADKTVTVELVDGSGTTACASRSALSPAVSQTLTFAKSTQATELGRKSIQFTVGRAHADLRCRVTDATQTPPVKGCSADNFAIRPAGFAISSANANADAAGASTTATPKIKTGANFSLTAATGVAGYGGTPLVDLTKLAAHAGATRAGTLAGGFGAADVATGTASGTTFTYDEAGYFMLGAGGVFDASFATVDSAAGDCSDNFSNTLVGGKYGCRIGNVAATGYFGRFIPDHFSLVPGATLPGCGSFTYFDQDGFSTPFTLAAENAANNPTQNYTGTFAKMDLTNWSSFSFAAAGLPTGSTLSASTTSPTGTWNSGTANVLAKHQISRPTALTGETKITVSAKPTDADGITTASAIAVATDTPLRFGRLRLFNAYGSISPLKMRVETQYWSGKSWVKNTDDSCTTTDGSMPQVVFSSPDGVTFKPNPLVKGEMILELDRSTSGPATINANVPDWLKSPDGDHPAAKATFGVYGTRESRKTIHVREIF